MGKLADHAEEVSLNHTYAEDCEDLSLSESDEFTPEYYESWEWRILFPQPRQDFCESRWSS